MDPLDTSDAARDRHDSDALHRELHTLRLTLQIALVALLIFAGSIGIYMFRQVSLLRRQTDATSRQAQQLVQLFNNSIGPQAQAFEKKLLEFAQTDPALRTRLAKYYPPADGTNAPAGPANPASAPTSTPPANP